MKKKEIRQEIKTVYGMLWDLLSLLEETEVFQKILVDGQQVDALYYLEEKIGGMKRFIYTHFLGEKKIKKACIQIVEETEYFVRSCEIPGVVERWMELNPRLRYYDVVFDIMEEVPKEYAQISQVDSPVKCAFHPDRRMLAERRRYFRNLERKNLRMNRKYSREKMYQEELLRTLSILFEKTFQEYL